MDHIVSSSDFHDNITSIAIDYDCTDVDHIPVLANIALTDMPIVTDVVNCDSRSSKLYWDKLNDSERKRYCHLTSEQLSAISVPDAVHCTNVNCSDPVHIEETTRFYIAILGSLQDASSSVFQQSVNGRGGSYSNKPGWADYVSDLYTDSRDMGKMWCNAGKPRQGQIF